jgi:two-component system, LytTR family, response regulator
MVATPGMSTPQPISDESPAAEKLVVRSGRTTHLLDISRIRWVSAEGKYARLWLPERNYLSQYSISEIEGRLCGRDFVRIHRSRIVSLRAVCALRSRGARDAEAVLDDGTTLGVSRRYRAELERWLGMRHDHPSRDSE